MPVLFAIVLIDLIGFGIVIPLLPFYGERFGASPLAVTLLMATYSFFQLFTAPLWGRLSDRRGRRPILLLSLCGSVAAYCWLGLADALWMLFAARAVQGAMAGNIAAAQAYIADVTTPENRAKGMGLIGAAFGLGFIIGPALGGLLAGPDPARPNFSAPAFLGAGLSFLALLGAVLVLKESLPVERRGAARVARIEAARRTLARPALRPLILVFFLIILAFAGMETTFALWANRQFGWGAAQVGYLMTYVGVVSATIQGGLIGKLARRFGEERVLLAGVVMISLGLLGIPFSSSLPIVLLASAFLAGGMGLTQPSINSLISRQAGAHEQGEVMGVAQSAGSLARILGPAIAGFLFGAYGRNAPYFAGAALMALVVALVRRFLRQEAPLLAPRPRRAP
ncbi:MAG: MFS transporter [Alphaproteobacteria bacterium]|nr:MFS transporter [Alphaproteobacteria bacterium]